MIEFQSLAVDSVQRAASGETGRISFGFARSSSRTLAASLVTVSRRQNPGIVFSLESNVFAEEGLARLVDGTLDLALVRWDKQPPEVTGRTVMIERLCAALPEDHRLAARSSLRVDGTCRRRLHHPARTSQFDAAREHDETVPRCRLHTSRGSGGPGLADDRSPRRRRAWGSQSPSTRFRRIRVRPEPWPCRSTSSRNLRRCTWRTEPTMARRHWMRCWPSPRRCLPTVELN